MQHRTVIAARNVRKAFAGVVVLEDVTFDVRAGEVHTLVGENGAGKSTLMKILSGAIRPDAGEIAVGNAEVTLASPRAARQAGIAIIHQEPVGFPDLTIAENIFVGHELPRGMIGQVQWRQMRCRARELLESLGVSIDPTTRLRELSIADQQMVELATALSQQARVLLMDEPTASLSPREVGRLFAIVRQLRTSGVGIVLISHRLPEVFEISDRITVLRDGRLIGTHTPGETSSDEIIRMMVGRPLSALYERTQAAAGERLLEVNALSRRGRFDDITFDIRAGEIVGLAGLIGAGRTDVARTIFGLSRADRGVVKIAGDIVSLHTSHDAVRAGLAYTPEDRQQHGVLAPMSVAVNTSIARLGAVSRLGWLSRRAETRVAQQSRDRFKTRMRDVHQPVRELSGGNQQKVVLGKWLLTEPRVLILDEPTRGIDVGAKAEVHHVMAELARSGKAVLMISSDLPEVLAMSDRVLVMREGRIAGRFARGEATQENIMAAATGGDDRIARAVNSRARERVRANPFWQSRELGVAVFVVLAFIACALVQPRFLSLDNLRSIALYLPLIVVVAMGQMMVIISRNIDLSVGSMLGLAAIIVGNQYIAHPNLSIGWAALIAAGIGAAAGAFNGVLVALLRVPAIIATLGTYTAYRGLIFIYSGGRQVDNQYLPASLINLSHGSLLGVPWIFMFAAIVALMTALWLRYTATGRNVFAIGSNPAAAVLRGLPVRGVLLLIFTITGMLSGIAGLMFASKFGYVNPVSTGAQMELVVISAVVIGGVNVFGGSGSVVGVLLGCLLLGFVNVALPMLAISAFWQTSIYGAAILLSASADTLIQRRAAGGAEMFA